jgi:hypothetical protein
MLLHLQIHELSAGYQRYLAIISLPTSSMLLCVCECLRLQLQELSVGYQRYLAMHASIIFFGCQQAQCCCVSVNAYACSSRS